MSDLSAISGDTRRNLILLAEIGALIHDAGKFGREFIIHQSCECSRDCSKNNANYPECSFNHTRIFGTGFLSSELDAILQDARWKPLLIDSTINQPTSSLDYLEEFISKHHSGNSGLLALVARCDRVDSGIDKGALQESAKQGCLSTYLASAFGWEQRLPIFRLYDRLVDERNQWSNEIYSSLEGILKGNSNPSDERSSIMKETEKAFRQALGETRRAANDVSLWDHAYSVASLQKAALAQVFLKNAWPGDLTKLQWRILIVAFDGLQFLENAHHISDLLCRLEIIRGALRNVKTLLEITLPMGNEIYSDENGSAFIVPDVNNLLGLEDDRGTALHCRIKEEFDKELHGEISIDLSPNLISKPSKYGIELGKLLSNPLPLLTSDVAQVRKTWDAAHEEEICSVCGLRPQGINSPDYERHYLRKSKNQECPRGCQTCKSISRKVCWICEKRRADRSKSWLSDMTATIWTDEVADSNGRMALIVASFDINDWLDGRLLSTILGQEFPKGKKYQEIVAQLSNELETNVRPDKRNPSLIQQMAPEAFRGNHDAKSFYDAFVNERDIHNLANGLAEDNFNARAELFLRFLLRKNPSFARLRRIWETTRGFWQDVCPTDETRNLQKSDFGKAVGLAGPRLEIRGKPRQKGGSENPGPYHAYDLALTKGIKLSVAWDPEEGINDGSKGRFISIDNLVYFASLAGEKAPHKEKNETELDYRSRLHRWAAKVIKELMLQEKALKIEEPTGYGGKAKEWGEIAVEAVEIIPDSQYTPAIPILAEPRTFMALVPADRALKVVNEIKAKYEREMGKVRNRLPLHLGIVYAHRRAPLRAILDAGRRMLRQSARAEGCKVVCSARKLADRGDLLPSRFSADKTGQFKEWLEVLLERDGRRIRWFVPAVMGDGQTQDQWYPYVFLDSPAEPADRDRRFRAPNPWTGSDGWLVHAADLKTDDVIYFTPATLDFQWLDSAGRRFEICYDDLGHRRSLPRRPYLLDELETLEEIWETLKSHLTKNQIYILRDLIETKREEWQVRAPRLAEDDPFWNFCSQALANAHWKRDPWQTEGIDRKRWLDRWASYGVRGWLADAIELYLQIMKEDISDEL